MSSLSADTRTNRVRPLRKQTEILSIYGQIESVVGRVMAGQYGLHIIEPKDVPEAQAFSDDGRPVQFAIVMPAAHLVEFHERCGSASVTDAKKSG